MVIKQVGYVASRSELLNAKHHPAADTAAIVTLTAQAGKVHFIHGFQWSYSTSPTGGALSISVNGTVVWAVAITGGGPGGFTFELAGGTNQEVVVTLATGTGSCVGKLNVQYTTESASSK